MKKYVEVDREPVVGDMVKIVKCTSVPQTDGVDDYKVGDILKIIGERDGFSHPFYHYKSDFNKVLRRSEFVVVEEVTQFSKSDLKPCMVVKTKNGDLYIVAQYKSGLSLISKDGWLDLYNYNSDLIRERRYEWSKSFDIMEVYGLNEYESHAMDISTDNRDLLFKREEQSPRDIKIKELQDKMDEIKREMEELK